MTRNKNDWIGRDGEDSIAKFLTENGAHIQTRSSHNGHPDLFFEHMGEVFAAECKTVRATYSGKEGERGGQLKISREEFESMETLEGFTKCLLVEIRPRGGGKENSYHFVPWNHVRDRFLATHPQLLSLSIWWVLSHGVNVAWWLDLRGYRMV